MSKPFTCFCVTTFDCVKYVWTSSTLLPSVLLFAHRQENTELSNLMQKNSDPEEK